MDDDSPPQETPTDVRLQMALAPAVVGALVAGFGGAGFLGSPWGGGWVLGFATLGALVAGYVEGRQRRERLVSALGFLVGTLSACLFFLWYVQGRSSVMKIELFVPMLGAAIPLGVARLVLRGLRTGRGGAAVDAALAMALVALPIAGDVVYLRPAIDTVASDRESRQVFQADLIMGADGTLTMSGAPLDSEALAATLHALSARGRKVVVLVHHLPDQSSAAFKAAMPLIQAAGLSPMDIKTIGDQRAPGP